MEIPEDRLNVLEDKMDAIYTEMVRIKRYFKSLMIFSIVMVLVPLIIAALALPSLLSTMTSMYGV